MSSVATSCNQLPCLNIRLATKALFTKEAQASEVLDSTELRWAASLKARAVQATLTTSTHAGRETKKCQLESSKSRSKLTKIVRTRTITQMRVLQAATLKSVLKWK